MCEGTGARWRVGGCGILGRVSALVNRLAAAVDQLLEQRPRVLVGIDGADAAGKTTLADRLAAEVASDVVRGSIDAFHNPVGVRRRRGELSPEGYYRDAFDCRTLVDDLLEPFAAGRATVATSSYDYGKDVAVRVDALAPARSVLVFDGVFLLREELRRFWTLSLFLQVSPEESLRRGVARDAAVFGSQAEAKLRYATRYLPAHALYRAEADPERVAHVLVDNTEPAAPMLRRWSAPTDP